ncbi:MAG: hypothetical protein ACAI25_09590 [Planctomycetota bacterium]
MSRPSHLAALLLGAALLASSPANAQPNGEPPGPATVRAAGKYRAGNAGDARLEMSDATKGMLQLGQVRYDVTGDPATQTLTGTTSGNIINALDPNAPAKKSTVSLRIEGRNVTNKDGTYLKIVDRLVGTRDGQPITLTRNVDIETISEAELQEFDPGPTGAWKDFFDSVPDYKKVLKDAGIDPQGKMFWYNFGPVFYRGRLDGTARVMVIASDPGPEECLPYVRHPMVGDAGQRVQGFLAKLGINKGYVLVNAYAYAMRPSWVEKNFGKAIITEDFSLVDPPVELTDEQLDEVAKITKWRNEFFTRVARAGKLEAIVPMGGNAWPAYRSWMASLPSSDPLRKVPVVRVGHPSAVDRDPGAARPDYALQEWQNAVNKLRTIVKPDAGVTPTRNYGAYMTENDYARVPRRDLPKEAPLAVGNGTGTRQVTGENNNARRPSPDDFKTLVWTDPKDPKKQIRYVYKDGVFKPELTTNEKGQKVNVTPTGIPIP